MRRLIAISLTVFALLAVLWMVSAQDDTTSEAESLERYLPMTNDDLRYYIGTGDTLDTIAALFDVSIECLMEKNGLTDSTIFPGDDLEILVECPPYIGSAYVPYPRSNTPSEQGGGGPPTYTVRPGDTLDTIASGFNVSLDLLLEANGITDPGTLEINQELVIPSSNPQNNPDGGSYTYDGRVPPLPNGTPEQGGGPDSEVYYVIQPGDTLDVLGAFYNANPECVAAANNIVDLSSIQPRTTIVIPPDCAPYTGMSTVPSRIEPLLPLPDTAPLGSTPIPTDPPVPDIPTLAPATLTLTPTTIPPTPTPEILEQGGGAEPTATVAPTDEPTAAAEVVDPTDEPVMALTPTTTEPTAAAEVVDPTTEPTAAVEPTPTVEQAAEGGGSGSSGELSNFFGALGSALNDPN